MWSIDHRARVSSCSCYCSWKDQRPRTVRDQPRRTVLNPSSSSWLPHTHTHTHTHHTSNLTSLSKDSSCFSTRSIPRKPVIANAKGELTQRDEQSYCRPLRTLYCCNQSLATQNPIRTHRPSKLDTWTYQSAIIRKVRLYPLPALLFKSGRAHSPNCR